MSFCRVSGPGPYKRQFRLVRGDLVMQQKITPFLWFDG
jgi:hypothetical protein